MGKRTDIKTGAESTSSMRVDRNSNIKQNYGNKGHYTDAHTFKIKKNKKKNRKILLIVVVAFLWHYNAILRIIFCSLFLFHSFCSFHGFLFFFWGVSVNIICMQAGHYIQLIILSMQKKKPQSVEWILWANLICSF